MSNKNIIENLISTALNFQMDSNYKRISSGKKLDINKKPYTMAFLDKMIKHFEDCEEYEKCRVLLSFKEDINNHESNYITSNK